MIQLSGQTLFSAAGRPFSFDLFCQQSTQKQPLLIFAHGFKGFKDWGHWGLIARFFADHGFAFLKFNFSHNGVTPEQPTEFANLDAFGQNNYTKESQDLLTLMDTLPDIAGRLPENTLDLDRIGLIGHSRGGALVLSYACLDARIKALATWASVSRLDYAWQAPGFIEAWEKEGVYHVDNARTGQSMPIRYQMYEDFQEKREQFDVKHCLQQMDRPLLIVHGTADPAVPATAAREIQNWHPDADLHLIHGADHVFGGSHPFEGEELPVHSRELVETTLAFFEKRL